MFICKYFDDIDISILKRVNASVIILLFYNPSPNFRNLKTIPDPFVTFEGVEEKKVYTIKTLRLSGTILAPRPIVTLGTGLVVRSVYPKIFQGVEGQNILGSPLAQ